VVFSINGIPDIPDAEFNLLADDTILLRKLQLQINYTGTMEGYYFWSCGLQNGESILT
jgi:hypothetical protein